MHIQARQIEWSVRLRSVWKPRVALSLRTNSVRRGSDQEGTVELEKRRMRLGDAVGRRPERSRARPQQGDPGHADHGRCDGWLLGWGDELVRCAVFRV